MIAMQKYLLIFSVALSSCAEPPPEEPYALPENALTLLSSDSTKTWKLARRFNDETRMNMGDCFLAYRQTYQSDMTLHDNNGEQRDCGETLQATWKFVKDRKGNFYVKWSSAQLPQLMNIEKDYKYFKILHLSADQLTLRFRHKFFSKTTTITDFYVPEGASVERRDFHW